MNKMLILVKPDKEGSGNAGIRSDWMRIHKFESASVFLSLSENPAISFAFDEEKG